MEEVDRDELFEEFIDYQSQTDDDIGPIAWEDAGVAVVDSNIQRRRHFLIDVFWYYLSQIRIAGTSLSRFNCFKPTIASVV